MRVLVVMLLMLCGYNFPSGVEMKDSDSFGTYKKKYREAIVLLGGDLHGLTGSQSLLESSSTKPFAENITLGQRRSLSDSDEKSTDQGKQCSLFETTHTNLPAFISDEVSLQNRSRNAETAASEHTSSEAYCDRLESTNSEEHNDTVVVVKNTKQANKLKEDQRVLTSKEPITVKKDNADRKSDDMVESKSVTAQKVEHSSNEVEAFKGVSKKVFWTGRCCC